MPKAGAKAESQAVDHKPDATDFFWDLAAEFLARDFVDEGSLMGFPCVRVNGDFFCTCDHRTGHLIVKLPKARVQELVEQGVSEPFAPAGRVFKEWTLVQERDAQTWTDLMGEAFDFVGGAGA